MENVTIGILCSSSNSANLGSQVLASTLISHIVKDKNYDYMMGAGNTGIMRNIQSILIENGHIPIIVGVKDTQELEQSVASYKIEVENTFERTKEIYQNSDIILALSGGMGTFSEVYSMIDANMESNTQKPIFIYNVDHSYDYFVQDFNQKVTSGFADESILDYFKVISTEEELLENLTNYEKKESEVIR